MQNMKMLVATLIITLGMVFGIGWVLSKMFSSTSSPTAPGMIVDQAELVTPFAQTKGASASAQFTIVEFSDFQCPACASTSPALNALVAQYPDKVRLVFRHFPLLSIHDSAMISAQFAEAAGLQGKFWEMNDRLFATQMEWSQQTVAESRAYFVDLGQELGLDTARLEADADSDAVRIKVEQDLRKAEQLQLSFTPTLFLNGERLDLKEIQQRIAAGVQASTESSEAAGNDTLVPSTKTNDTQR